MGSKQPKCVPRGSSAGWSPSRRAGHVLVPALVALALLPGPAASSVSEDEVKAAFLLNFTRFVDWPDSSFAGTGAPFVICVLDDPAFAAKATEVIGDRTVGERGVSVSDRDGVNRASGCHILFVPSSHKDLHGDVIDALADESIFTVSDSDGFASMGGVANFKRAGAKLGLEINREAANKARLKVSSRLLRIAEVVG